jgi:hypothetical protein
VAERIYCAPERIYWASERIYCTPERIYWASERIYCAPEGYIALLKGNIGLLKGYIGLPKGFNPPIKEFYLYKPAYHTIILYVWLNPNKLKT